MSGRSRWWHLWAPRILALLVCSYLGLFALDAFGPGKPVGDALADFALHVTPLLVLLAVVVVSWRWEWVGACVFSGLAIVYALVAADHFSWILAVSVPLLVVGVLYAWNWRHHRELHTRA